MHHYYDLDLLFDLDIAILHFHWTSHIRYFKFKRSEICFLFIQKMLRWWGYGHVFCCLAWLGLIGLLWIFCHIYMCVCDIFYVYIYIWFSNSFYWPSQMKHINRWTHLILAIRCRGQCLLVQGSMMYIYLFHIINMGSSFWTILCIYFVLVLVILLWWWDALINRYYNFEGVPWSA